MALLVKLIINFFSPFNCPTKQQKIIIDSMPEPQNDYERVYFNYKCNSYGKKAFWFIFFNVLGIIALPLFLFIYLINTLKSTFQSIDQCDAIIISAGNRAHKKYIIDGIIPNEIKLHFKRIETIEMDVFPSIFDGVITITAFKFWWSFFCRHPYSGYLNFRCLFTIMAFNRLILKYSPKAIVVSRFELNNMSSIISLYCEKHGAEFINFMHGEVFTNIQTAFVRFSHFYVWDEHYLKVFAWGRCPQNQFVIYTPAIYSVTIDEDIKPDYFLTYVFTGNEITRNDFNAVTVKNILVKLTKYGLHCKVRPHPRWSDLIQITDVFANTDILVEDPRVVSAKESILLSEKIVGTYSTMLSEAYHKKKAVVIDDITNPDLIKELQEKKYIMLEKKHELLSELVHNYC